MLASSELDSTLGLDNRELGDNLELEGNLELVASLASILGSRKTSIGSSKSKLTKSSSSSNNSNGRSSSRLGRTIREQIDTETNTRTTETRKAMSTTSSNRIQSRARSHSMSTSRGSRICLIEGGRGSVIRGTRALKKWPGSLRRTRGNSTRPSAMERGGLKTPLCTDNPGTRQLSSLRG